MQKENIVFILILLICYGCSSISTNPPLVYNARVGVVNAEHIEFKKDTRDCGLEGTYDAQPISPEIYTVAKGVEEVAGSNTITTVLLGYGYIKGTHAVIDRIGKCIEARGWTVVAQESN